MRHKPLLTRSRGKQGGYALLLVVFLTALLVVSTASIGLKIVTEGKREKEQEMIWRGKQYTRGIKMYYRKLGRFPNSLDDLTKPKIGNIRFMRQAYKDPMNKEDGSWRLIYVGPAGNLIGSLNQSLSSVQMPGAGGTGQPATGPVGGQTSTGILGSNPTAGSTGTPPGGIGAGSAGTPPGTPAGAPGTATGTGTDTQAVPTGDTPTIMGGSIIGIGSKINQPSVIIFEKAQNYRLFEFIWDPSKDLGIGVGGQQIGTPPGTPQPGQSPTGQPPTGIGQPPNPLNPPQIPPTGVPPNPSQP
ncbi:MAG TPA: hypothetical protein VNX28_01745 [Gemmataceae bacterium]|nr:hypothetical protein [Gemmataceae bacterium]